MSVIRIFDVSVELLMLPVIYNGMAGPSLHRRALLLCANCGSEYTYAEVVALDLRDFGGGHEW